MKNSLPLISIQILNWNRPEETVRAIHSAYNQSYPNFEVVIIDNGSTDHSVELIKTSFPEIKIIELDKNYGCPGGRNKGIEHCNGEYIFYLDNDGVLHKDALNNAYNSFLKDKNIVLVTGLIVDFIDPNEIDTEYEINITKAYYFANFSGGVSMHKKAMYQKTGLFPSHFMYGAEELFLSHRIIDSGFKIVKNENVVLWHKKSNRSRNHANETINSYFNKLYTSIVLFPSKYLYRFLFYFITVYFYHAYKAKVLLPYSKVFFSRLFGTIKSGLKDRNPISISSFLKIKNFKKTFIEE